MSRFRLLTKSEVFSNWKTLRERLSPAVNTGSGELEVDDILNLVLADAMFILADDNLAVTVELIHYPRTKVLLVGFGAGKVKNYAEALQEVKVIASILGASSIRAHCSNPAMERYFKRYFGIDRLYSVMEVKA